MREYESPAAVNARERLEEAAANQAEALASGDFFDAEAFAASARAWRTELACLRVVMTRSATLAAR